MQVVGPVIVSHSCYLFSHHPASILWPINKARHVTDSELAERLSYCPSVTEHTLACEIRPGHAQA